jgi:hypothetical protein
VTVTRMSRAPVSRGCGQRKAGGVYACCGLSEHGLPIEHFLIDPVQALAVQCFRAPIVIPDPEDADLKHMAIWVGAEYYPSPWDYIEETRRLGASRRIPGDFDFSVLTPGRSRMILVHPHAYTKRIDLPDSCPKELLEEGHGKDVACLGALRHYVDALGCAREEASDTETELAIRIGDIAYAVPQRQIAGVERSQFSPGAFMQLPISHFEYQAKDASDSGPEEFSSRCESTGYAGVIVDDDSSAPRDAGALEEDD